MHNAVAMAIAEGQSADSNSDPDLRPAVNSTLWSVLRSLRCHLRQGRDFYFEPKSNHDYVRKVPSASGGSVVWHSQGFHEHQRTVAACEPRAGEPLAINCNSRHGNAGVLAYRLVGCAGEVHHVPASSRGKGFRCTTTTRSRGRKRRYSRGSA